MDKAIEFARVIVWPLAVFGLVLIFRDPFSRAIDRLLALRASSKGGEHSVELVLDNLEKRAPLSQGTRIELSGLSSPDIWALSDFSTGRITTTIAQMNVAQRVAARTLIDFRLLTIDGQETNKKVVLTPLGHQLLEAANSIRF